MKIINFIRSLFVEKYSAEWVNKEKLRIENEKKIKLAHDNKHIFEYENFRLSEGKSDSPYFLEIEIHPENSNMTQDNIKKLISKLDGILDEKEQIPEALSFLIKKLYDPDHIKIVYKNKKAGTFVYISSKKISSEIQEYIKINEKLEFWNKIEDILKELNSNLKKL